EGRKSIHAARKAKQFFEENGDEAEVFDPAEKDIPMLQERRYKVENPHPDVEEFGQKVEEADGIVLVAPEYNHTYPGALKNLLDHLYPEYEDKPFSYITVSGGGFGGVRCLEQLKLLTVTLNGHPGPELPVSRVGSVFDEEGELVDKDYEERFKDFVRDVSEHAEKFSSST
ncbi:MAG: NADPH-dependent FMN reductase, partial [Candidatus Nanohaloarchaea archaeon]